MCCILVTISFMTKQKVTAVDMVWMFSPPMDPYSPILIKVCLNIQLISYALVVLSLNMWLSTRISIHAQLAMNNQKKIIIKTRLAFVKYLGGGGGLRNLTLRQSLPDFSSNAIPLIVLNVHFTLFHFVSHPFSRFCKDLSYWDILLKYGHREWRKTL